MSGPVFPQDKIETDGKRTREGGMLLRDYFAAQALGMVLPIAKGATIEEAVANAAKTSYLFADAMMKERSHVSQ